MGERNRYICLDTHTNIVIIINRHESGEMKSEKHESDRPIKPMKRRAAEWTEYNLAVPPHKKEKMSSELDSGISSKTELHLEHNHDSDEFAKQKVVSKNETI